MLMGELSSQIWTLCFDAPRCRLNNKPHGADTFLRKILQTWVVCSVVFLFEMKTVYGVHRLYPERYHEMASPKIALHLEVFSIEPHTLAHTVYAEWSQELLLLFGMWPENSFLCFLPRLMGPPML